MDSETALEMVKQGTTLLLLDVPQFTLFGIDTQVFSVGPIFKGIKMIPPGPHFVYYSSSNRSGSEFSPIVGFFIHTQPSEVIVRKWDQQQERLIKVSEEEEERYITAVRKLELDHQLGPYDLNHSGDWIQLSNYITKSTIDRIEPIGGEITISQESEAINWAPKSTMEKALEEQLRNTKYSKNSDRTDKQHCYYTVIPRVVKHKGIGGQELTSLNLDKTQLLETILMKQFGDAEDLLLGELQFAFVAFLMGQSLEAFFQWKALVSLLFSCTEAPFHTRSHLFTKFVKVIYYQLKFGLQKDHTSTSSGGKGTSFFLDDSWFSPDNFLNHLCKEFFPLVLEASVVDGDLLSWTRKLKALLETTLGWEFKQIDPVCDIYDENDEYAPVIEMLED
ncbi:hypothetical protein AQUCO_00201211v1 [Aquilegia coerulea]|uniref:Protein AAR2 homolog n=1 Tax=Aquilegia coerulea TaxID=218851 RepID=A0A2G5F6R9_AQUCA|nr:hypothetical protein AQUCO_00201211v1 [Aquilegia coerulea]